MPILLFSVSGWEGIGGFRGTLFGLQQWDIIVSLIILFILGFLFIGNDAWTVVLGIVASLIACTDRTGGNGGNYICFRDYHVIYCQTIQ